MKKRLIILLIVAMVILIPFWYLFFHRVEEVVVQDGWRMEWSYMRMRCTTCFGRINRLAYQGRPIEPPVLSSNDEQRFPLSLWTPVALVETYPDHQVWRYRNSGRKFTASGEAITAAELAQGYYDRKEQNAPKPGTPDSWCQVSCGNIIRWLDPALLHTFNWSELAARKELAAGKEAADHTGSDIESGGPGDGNEPGENMKRNSPIEDGL